MRSYLNRGAEKTDLLKKLCEDKEWKDYTIEVHSLKSTSMTIGSENLFELAKELEAAGKEENVRKINARNQDLLDLYREVLMAGQAYMEKAVVTDEKKEKYALTEVSDSQVREWVQNLLNACDNFNVVEVKNICQSAYECVCREIPLRPMFEAVKLAAEDFEFDDASQKAQEILNILGEEA